MDVATASFERKRAISSAQGDPRQYRNSLPEAAINQIPTLATLPQGRKYIARKVI